MMNKNVGIYMGEDEKYYYIYFGKEDYLQALKTKVEKKEKIKNQSIVFFVINVNKERNIDFKIEFISEGKKELNLENVGSPKPYSLFSYIKKILRNEKFLF